MDFWIIRNGEKSGPFRDYELREKIEIGEAKEDDYVWHEGLDGWRKLQHIELFQEEFKKKPQGSLPPPLPDMREVVSAMEPEKLHLVRRFWARWVDLSVFSALWWLGIYLSGQNVEGALKADWIHLTIYVPWFILEGWMIHTFGTTPGKWLLGLRVVNEDGTKLGGKAATWRSLRVYVVGLGFGLGVMVLLMQVISFMMARSLGRPLWDHIGKHKVVASPQRPLGIVAVVVLFLVSGQLKMAVVGPYAEKEILKNYPEMKEMFEGQRKFYFPEK